MKQTKSGRLRIYVLGGIVLAILLSYTGVLFKTQLIDGDEYLERSIRTIAKLETVEAARGTLTDRNGQHLAYNRPAYSLTFDASLLSDGDDENAAILRLVNLCQSQGVAWADNLPITAAAPFSYTLESLDSVQRSRFLSFLQNGDGKTAWVDEALAAEELTEAYLLTHGLSPQVLLSRMEGLYSLEGSYTDGEARKILGVQYELSLRRLRNITAYVLAEDVSNDLISLLTDGDYAGARIDASSVREYATSYAAHILGTVGMIPDSSMEELTAKGYAMDDIIGRSGVEAAFEDYLRGTDGTRVVSTNEEGKVTGEFYSEEPEPGNTVELTIDLQLQQATEDALAATISRMIAQDGIEDRGAGAAVVRVGSGEVLSLASYPTFSAVTYRQEYASLEQHPGAPLFNRATQGTYPPGSTFKPLSAVAALESGVITTSTLIRDEGVYMYYYPSYYPHCWIYPGSHGRVNVTEAIKVSCNYFFYDVGRRMGIQTLDEYASAFGLGRKTGIEIYEEPGVLAGPEYSASVGQPWYEGSTLQAAIGQSDNLFTPLQLANYIATLVSGGEHYQAHLLKTVKSYDNAEILALGTSTPENTVQMSDATLQAVKRGMYELTTSGSLSSYFASCVVDAGAKTGTAQLGGDVKDNGVFVCFAPYDDPEIALALVIEKGGSGAALASTAVEILNAYFTADEIGAVVIGENQLIP